MSDGTDSTLASQSFTLDPVNDAPALTEDQAILAAGSEDVVYNVSIADLKLGFSDVDNTFEDLSVTDFAIDRGSFRLSDDGTYYEITAPSNFSGDIRISYNVSDGVLKTAATQTVSFNPENDLPLLTGLQAVLPQGTEDFPYTVSLSKLLQGYTDAEGDGLSVINLTVSDGGIAVQNDDLSWTITPDANFFGTLTISYEISDGKGSVPASLTFELTDAPELDDELDPITFEPMDEDAEITITKAQLLQNYTGDDKEAILSEDISFSIASGSGALTFNTLSDEWTYTPARNDDTNVAFAYTFENTLGRSVGGRINLDLLPINDAPELTGEEATLVNGVEDFSYTISKGELLQGYTDPEGSPLTIDIDAISLTGGATIEAVDENNFVIHTPQDVNGEINITYFISDGEESIEVTRTITFDPINDAPVLSGPRPELPNGFEDTDYTISKGALLQGYTDVDEDDLSIVDLYAGAGVTVTPNLDGSYTIRAANNYSGPINLTYKVDDGTTSVDATYTYTIEALNDPPTGTATAELASASEDQDGGYTVNV
ncbi:MAG: tandem-95 repeat protein, partial [Actinobacteria bacterium]|nr:tandem-95 repeat protein [Actinomycetota bacterium]